MSKQRKLSDEEILNLLIELREEEAKKDSFTEITINKEQCKEIGIFTYKIKETGKKEVSQLFLIKELHDDKEVNLIYNEKGKLIAWSDYEEDKEQLKIAQDIEIKNEKLLKRQIMLGEEKDSKLANDTEEMAGEGRDLASKEHEEKTKEDTEEEKKKEKTEEEKEIMPNLKGKINLNNRTRIRLDTIINGYCLWEILNIEESLRNRLPESMSERGFRNEFLTLIDSKELEQLDGKERKADYTFAICSSDGDVIELDEQVLEPQDLGSYEDTVIAGQNEERFADGHEVEKPVTDAGVTRKAKWKIPDAYGRFGVNEEWYLGVDINKEYQQNGKISTNSKIYEISFIQEPRETNKIYSPDSSEAKTRESLSYKLEDAQEASLNAEEEKQQEQLREKDSNEAVNVRKKHLGELQQIVERLTEKYGENYRDDIEEEVEEYHEKGMDAKDIEKNINEHLEDIEDENFRHPHGRSRIF